MAFDAHANFATSLVATAPSPATSGTSLVVTAAQGSRFPAAPFNAVIGPANTLLTPANAEIVRVTVVSTDTLTITRAQEGSSARTVVVGDQVFCGPTVKTFTDLEVVDAAAGTGSLRTLGTGATNAAAGNDSRFPVIAALTADATAITSNTTLANIGLALAIGASATEIWLVEAFLLIKTANVTMDFKVGFSVPASCTMWWGPATDYIQSAGSWMRNGLATTAPTLLAAAGTLNGGGAGSANPVGLALIALVYGGGTSGNVNLQLAQNTSDPGNLQALKGSLLRSSKLAA